MANMPWWGDIEGIKFPHLIHAKQFSREQLERFCHLTGILEMTIKKERKVNWLWGRRVLVIFFQPSTRTYLSFITAAQSLSADVIHIPNAKEETSDKKREVTRDSARVISGIIEDLIVLRHPAIGSAREWAKFSKAPIINGGDGPGQHPTQALLDIYTIQHEFGKIDGLKIAMVGDLSNGRTVHSLCYLLSKFNGVEIVFVSPERIKMKDDIKHHLSEVGTVWSESVDLATVMRTVDVVYQTRIQEEYFSDITEYNAVAGIYKITRDMATSMRGNAIIMHPLPRTDEIRYGVDTNPRARYFDQSDRGKYVRMSLLLCALNPQKAEELLAQ